MRSQSRNHNRDHETKLPSGQMQKEIARSGYQNGVYGDFKNPVLNLDLHYSEAFEKARRKVSERV